MKVLVISGDGINCENETRDAFTEAGAEARILHVNEWLTQNDLFKGVQAVAFPGGFSFGDEVRSGKILAEKIKTRVGQDLKAFLCRGGVALGICNGFQVLMQLGVFDENSENRYLTLAHNAHGKFWNDWVRVLPSESARRSIWFKGVAADLEQEGWHLPMRHGEGRIIAKNADTFRERKLAVLAYDQDVNGSVDRTAGIVDATGRILGLMPHPEAALQSFLHPSHVDGVKNAKLGRKFFKQIVNAVKAGE